MIGRLNKVPVSEMYAEGGAGLTAWLRDNLEWGSGREPRTRAKEG